jgi:hypothetical protein
MLRKIFGLKRDEIIGGWRKLHNEKIHNFPSSPNRMIKSMRMRWTEHLARIGANKNSSRALVGNPEGKRSLGRPRPIWWNKMRWYGLD